MENMELYLCMAIPVTYVCIRECLLEHSYIGLTNFKMIYAPPKKKLASIT